MQKNEINVIFDINKPPNITVHSSAKRLGVSELPPLLPRLGQSGALRVLYDARRGRAVVSALLYHSSSS